MLVSLDSVRLQESDSLYLGKVYTFTVGSEGDFYLPDAFARHVVRFGRDGRIIRTYGRYGSGPGEFEQVGQPLLLGDSLLVVTDGLAQRVQLFSVASGAFRHGRPITGVPRDGAADGNVVWFGDERMDKRTSLAAWDRRTDSITYLGSIPDEYVQSPVYAGTMPEVRLAHWADTLLVGHAGRNELLLLGEYGSVLDTVDIPTVRRRGVPADIVEVIKNSKQGDFWGKLSTLWDLYRRPGGDFVLVHSDSKKRRSADGTLLHGFESKLWVSVLSRDRKEACVDSRVPSYGDVNATTDFRGDTLFVLDRRIEGDRVESWIRWYSIDTSRCDWLPTG